MKLLRNEAIKELAGIMTLASRCAIFTIGLAFCSCQNFNYVFSSEKVDRELQPYLNNFLKEAHDHGYNLDPKELNAHLSYFNQDEEENPNGKQYIVIGRCYDQYFRGRPYIVLLQDHWYAMTHPQREALFFHEAAHCLLGSNHTDSLTIINNEVIKASIMNPVIPTPEMYASNRKYYMDELFKFQVDRDYVKKFLKKPVDTIGE